MPQKLYFESECFWICMHNTLENEYTTAFSIGLDRVVQLFNVISPLTVLQGEKLQLHVVTICVI